MCFRRPSVVGIDAIGTLKLGPGGTERRSDLSGRCFKWLFLWLQWRVLARSSFSTKQTHTIAGGG